MGVIRGSITAQKSEIGIHGLIEFNNLEKSLIDSAPFPAIAEHPSTGDVLPSLPSDIPRLPTIFEETGRQSSQKMSSILHGIQGSEPPSNPTTTCLLGKTLLNEIITGDTFGADRIDFLVRDSPQKSLEESTSLF